MRRRVLIATAIVLSGCGPSLASSHTHDAVSALSEMSGRFLVDYFGDSSVSPEASLVDFYDDCPGKSAELDDVRANRALLTIQSAEARITQVRVWEDTGEADIEAACAFHDTLKSTGARGTTQGTCKLTGVYRDGRWWLCDSTMDGRRTCDDGSDGCNARRGQ